MDAVFSPCGQFRFLLSEVWDDTLPILPWVLFNPSVAGTNRDGRILADPTWRKGRGYSERLGYGGQVFANCYAYIATDPKKLKREGYPVGAGNDAYIEQACRMGDGKVVCAWGALGAGLVRPGKVLALIRAWGFKPMAIAVTKDGLPRHPARTGYVSELVAL